MRKKKRLVSCPLDRKKRKQRAKRKIRTWGKPVTLVGPCFIRTLLRSLKILRK